MMLTSRSISARPLMQTIVCLPNTVDFRPPALLATATQPTVKVDPNVSYHQQPIHANNASIKPQVRLQTLLQMAFRLTMQQIEEKNLEALRLRGFTC